MGTRRSPSAPQWQVILEEMRSENRATLEAVLAFRSEFDARVDRIEREGQERDATLMLAIGDVAREVRAHSTDLTELKRLALRHGSDIVDIKGELVEVKSDIVSLKQGVSELKQDVSELKELGRQHTADIAELRVAVADNTKEIRDLSERIDGFGRLEGRVVALERRAADSEGGGRTPPPA